MTTQQIIEEKLVGGFDLQHLQVINESGQHNVPDGSESHFKVVLVAEAFEGTRLIARHRLVNETLADDSQVGYMHCPFTLTLQRNGENGTVMCRCHHLAWAELRIRASGSHIAGERDRNASRSTTIGA